MSEFTGALPLPIARNTRVRGYVKEKVVIFLNITPRHITGTMSSRDSRTKTTTELINGIERFSLTVNESNLH
jgi:hypothetical protein